VWRVRFPSSCVSRRIKKADPVAVGDFSWLMSVLWDLVCALTLLSDINLLQFSPELLSGTRPELSCCTCVCLFVRHMPVLCHNSWTYRVRFWHTGCLWLILHCVGRVFRYLQKQWCWRTYSQTLYVDKCHNCVTAIASVVSLSDAQCDKLAMVIHC